MTIVAEKPLLLQSVPGAGKSFLIDEVAKFLEDSKVILFSRLF